MQWKLIQIRVWSDIEIFIKENKEIYDQQEIPQLTCHCEKCENFKPPCEGIKHSETSLKLLPTSACAALPNFSCNYCEETWVDEVWLYQWSKPATKKCPEVTTYWIRSLSVRNLQDRIEYSEKNIVSCLEISILFSIGIHSMQGWTATRHGVTRKRSTIRLKDTGNLLRKNLQLIGVC